MKSNDLVYLLAPFALIANKHSMAPAYKVLEVLPDMLRGCAAYGVVEQDAELGADKPFVIDTTTFVAVVKSMPSGEDVKLEIKGDALHWECGLATGKLALIKAEVKVPAMPPFDLSEPWDVPDVFTQSLLLGGLSCGDHSLASAGIYGIVIDNRTDLTIYSSDDVTISACVAGESVGGLPSQLVISPEANKLLILLLSRGKTPQLSSDSKAIYAATDGLRALVKPIPDLKHDLAALAVNFASRSMVAELPRERVSAFLKRAAAIAESSQHASVDIAATDGALSLSIIEDRAASEEYYLAEGLNVPNLPPIRIEASRIARALAHTNRIIFDHVARGVLVLSGDKPTFSYVISGKRNANS